MFLFKGTECVLLSCQNILALGHRKIKVPATKRQSTYYNFKVILCIFILYSFFVHILLCFLLSMHFFISKAIHGYRETQRIQWREKNKPVIQRIRDTAFLPGTTHLPHVHILDIKKEGFIKPHVDAVKV